MQARSKLKAKIAQKRENFSKLADSTDKEGMEKALISINKEIEADPSDFSLIKSKAMLLRAIGRVEEASNVLANAKLYAFEMMFELYDEEWAGLFLL